VPELEGGVYYCPYCLKGKPSTENQESGKSNINKKTE